MWRGVGSRGHQQRRVYNRFPGDDIQHSLGEETCFYVIRPAFIMAQLSGRFEVVFKPKLFDTAGEQHATTNVTCILKLRPYALHSPVTCS